jgi:hypothetical protein
MGGSALGSLSAWRDASGCDTRRQHRSGRWPAKPMHARLHVAAARRRVEQGSGRLGRLAKVGQRGRALVVVGHHGPCATGSQRCGQSGQGATEPRPGQDGLGRPTRGKAHARGATQHSTSSMTTR